MNISAPFIQRPIATILVMVALLVAGLIGYILLPVSALPSVDFPTISVSAQLPGADPKTMASAVAQPLERQFAQIPGVNQITSASVLGTTNITLQFDLSRNIDGAAGDVQQAINAAQGFLPKNLPNPPTYRKVNPADQPILILGLTSDSMPLTQVDQFADLDIAQRISTLDGVGQVSIFGQQKYAPTVLINPLSLAARGIGLDEIASAVMATTANLPVGSLQGPTQAYQIATNGQLFLPAQIAKAIVTYRNGAPVRIGDVAQVVAGVDSPLQAAWVGEHRGEMIGIWRQPGANTLELVDRLKSMLPTLQAGVPPAIKLSIVSDRSISIRDSFSDVKITLMGTIALVIVVIFVFLREFWATIIPALTVPLSLVGTFAVMFGLGYSLDNLSLMALTLAVGLVVDDAIVMLENIFRHMEMGKDRVTAALDGSKEIGFTIVSITISLIAVFIPLLFMAGIVGRLFREFGVTVTVAIVLSAFIALTLSPMIAALVLKNPHSVKHGRLYQMSERGFEKLVSGYEHILKLSLRYRAPVMILNVALIAISIYLFMSMPKGFFPQEDTGMLTGFMQADQDISFDGMKGRQEAALRVLMQDSDITAVGSLIGGNASSGFNTGRAFIQLKPVGERHATADQIIQRLRLKLAEIPGILTYLQSVQNIQLGGRISRTQYQYTLQDTDINELDVWAPKLLEKLKGSPLLQDVASDQQTGSPMLMIDVDRDAASRLGVNISTVQQTLSDAYGQAYVTQIYAPLNTYHVVMEVEPEFQRDVTALSQLYVRGSGGAMVQVSQFARLKPIPGTIAVNHQGQFPAVTLSFNLAPGTALGEAVEAIRQIESSMGKPTTLQTSFQGTAQEFQRSLATQPLLLAAALFAVYIVLGILYESFIHPFTILLSLPSASVGALISLKLFGLDLSMMAIIGLIMLIGIVKKNAIMMIDFALQRERIDGLSPEQSVFEACVLRFRPIMMTTMAALFGTLPIAFGIGAGADLRQPLGVSVVGGLIVSQALTLFTTPVTYLYMDQFSRWLGKGRRNKTPPDAPRLTERHGADQAA
ncbi:acriflavin resistance protein [Methylocella silvestris BL2]|uniref:Acriflavin resistance protein n=1 Tax=Methylocella silvestris (strain DSM 15510 / CIP 108128 / LMG 27833 / NCIMB 13906 / BL2) TaxID=395965 RepID=B8ES80_METSB|nr:efflux RND transporter permease subunit [Methylocella silvestris]ACK52295.1 acriflavin resistance protein [Methylocella silvestris BL2]